MVIAAIFVCKGLFFITSIVSQTTDEISSLEIKLILNLKEFGVLKLFLLVYLLQMSTLWLKETRM